MNFSEEIDIELIERYLRNELTAEERVIFMNRMKEDPEFAEKTEDYSLIIHGIAKQGATGFQEELAIWEHEIRNEESEYPDKTISTPKKEKKLEHEINWPRYLSIAAAVSVFIVGFVFLVDYKKDQKLNRLLTAHFIPYDELLSTRGQKTHVTLSEALESYNEKNYSEAVSRFDSYLKEHPQDYQAWFYFGVSQLAADKNADALNSFNIVIDNKTIFQDSAEWYKALALLKLDHSAEAKRLLDQIAHTEGHDYQAKASALLREL